MTTTQDNTKERAEENKDEAIKPDAATLHTTDPQEHMTGILSSLMQGTKDSFKDNGSEEEVKDAKE